jgi:cellulose synthase operon protein B
MGFCSAILAKSKSVEMTLIRLNDYLMLPRKLVGVGALFFLFTTNWFNNWADAQTQPLQGQSAPAVAVAVAVAPVPIIPATRTVSLDLKQLGSWSAVKLKGMDASKVLAFTVRTDEVVVAAKFKLGYDYSPSLIEELSHLQIHLNDRVVAIEGLPKGKNLGVKSEVNLEVGSIRDYNELRFNFVGFASGKCGPGMNASLWLTLSETSRLELTLAPKPITPDLKNLPAPFYDKRDNQALNLPFVFSSNPSLGTLKAAGIVASWFGIQAGNRGAQFPAFLNEIPPTNAIVFLNNKDEAAGFKGVPGAVVSVQVNPNNPNARLLLINGSTDAELLRAAKAVALVHTSLSGKDAAVVSDTEMAPRQPYDAPAWVRTDRQVSFGELAKLEDLRVKGFIPDAIRINYRLPPDLFTWRTSGVPMQLKYRATRLPGHKNSNLKVSLNNNFIDAMALNEPLQSDALNAKKQSGNSSVWETSLFLPPYALSMRDQLQLGYSFDILKDGECPEPAPDNIVAAIDAESTLDFSVFPKYAALPNLAFFSQLGFPFTRYADLAETAVVISERPSADEISVYLSVLGRMGEATGLPSLRHSLLTASEVGKSPDKDFIVIGTAQNQRLFADWANALPMYVENGIRRLREPDVSWRPSYRWEQKDTNIGNVPRGSVSLSGTGSLATIMAFESPLKPTRSVVFLYADKPSDFKRITNVLTDPDVIGSVQGDFVIAGDKSVTHTTVSPTYYLGSLPWQSKLKWFLADNPILVAFLALILALLSAVIIYRPLKFLGAKVFKKAG